jgi:hypothetical protein
MSDMTNNTDTTQDSNDKQQLPKENVQQEFSSNDSPTYTKAQLDEMLNKARQQEKDKLYRSLEDANKQSEKLKSEHERVQKEYLKTQERLKTLQDDKMSDLEKVNKQIESIIAENESLRQKIDSVSKEADERITRSQINAYRQDRIKSEGLLFSDMVTGVTKEEIDASILEIKNREQAIRQQMEDQVRLELKDSLPKAISPNSVEPSIAPASDRYRISKLKGDDYANIRQKLLTQALEKMRS